MRNCFLIGKYTILVVQLSYFGKQQNIAIYAIKCMLQFRHNINVFHDADSSYHMPIISLKGILQFVSVLFTDNFTNTMNMCIYGMKSRSRFRHTCASLVPLATHNVAQEPDQLMRKLNIPQCIRFNLAYIFSAWTSGSTQIYQRKKETVYYKIQYNFSISIVCIYKI